MVSGGVVSPQGRHFAFIAREQQTGRTSLWIRAVNALEPQRVPGADGASQPFFSPDGKTIAFFANGRLLATDVTGTHTRTIASVQGALAGGSWGANDIIVFAEWMTGLYAVPARGGAVSRLTRLDHTALDVAHAWPQFLPDGRRFLYQVISPDSTRAGVYVANVDASGSTRLLDYATAATYVSPGFLRVPAARHADGRAVRRRATAIRWACCAAGARRDRAITGRWDWSLSLARHAGVSRGYDGAAVDVGGPIGAAAKHAASADLDVQLPALA